MMPGEYLAILGTGSKEMFNKNIIDAIDKTATISGQVITKFAITGLAITDKDVDSAKKLLLCMSNIYEDNKKKGEKVFDNMMLEPMFSTIVEFLNNVAEKRDATLYIDYIKHRINLQGPIIKEGKYFWPIIRQGKYIEHVEY